MNKIIPVFFLAGCFILLLLGERTGLLTSKLVPKHPAPSTVTGQRQLSLIKGTDTRYKDFSGLKRKTGFDSDDNGMVTDLNRFGGMRSTGQPEVFFACDRVYYAENHPCFFPDALPCPAVLGRFFLSVELRKNRRLSAAIY